jgi:hypothetical protein
MVAVDHTVVRLRCLVQDCLSNGLHASAVFHADKLVTLSGGSISDTYLLAQVRLSFKGSVLAEPWASWKRGLAHAHGNAAGACSLNTACTATPFAPSPMDARV